MRDRSRVQTTKRYRPRIHIIMDMTSPLDRATRDYSDIWIIGDLNFDLLDRTTSITLRDVCDIYGLDQLIKEPTNTTIHESSLFDVILTTAPPKTSSSGSTNVGLCDTHNMIYTTLKLMAPRLLPTTITYCDVKHFREDAYSSDVSKIPKTVCQIYIYIYIYNDDPSDNCWALLSLTSTLLDPSNITHTHTLAFLFKNSAGGSTKPRSTCQIDIYVCLCICDLLL